MTDNQRYIRVRRPVEPRTSEFRKMPVPGLLNLNEAPDPEFLQSTEAWERASELIRTIALAATVAASEEFTHEFIQWAGQ